MKYESNLAELMLSDYFLKEKSADWPQSPVVLPRIAGWRVGTELLGSVQAVEDRFDKITEGLQALSEIASSLAGSIKQCKCATAALAKA